MIDFETELRDRLDRTADAAPTGDDLLPAIERRAAAQGRRVAALRVAAVVAVLGLAGATGVAIAADGGGDAATSATDPGGPAASRGPGSWATMADAPIEGRFQHLAVAMDDQVLVTSGYATAEADLPADAAVYDTVAGTWRTVPDPPLFPGSAEGVWTGREAIVISAEGAEEDGPTPGSARRAAAFDPATDTWRELATPPPGVIATAVTGSVWTGSEMVVVTSTWDDASEVLVYDPEADTWREAAAPTTPIPGFTGVVWTGSEVAVVGYDQPDDPSGTFEIDPDAPDGDGDGIPDVIEERAEAEPVIGEMVVELYDPAADTWRTLPWGPLGVRQDVAVAWTGTHLFVGGGTELVGEGYAADGALLDPTTGGWTTIAEAPTAYAGDWRYGTVWTGAEAILFAEDGRPLRYDPAADVWTEGATPPGEAVWDAPAVWSAGRLVVPLGGHEDPITGEDGQLAGSQCCARGPAGGLTYTP